MRVFVTGDQELITKLERFQRLSDLEKAYDDSGKTVAGIAEKLVPVDTGRLQKSIRYRGPGNDLRLKQKTIVQAGTRGFPYAPIVHYGKMPGWTAQPFLTDALSIGYGATRIIFDKEMDETIREIF